MNNDKMKKGLDTGKKDLVLHPDEPDPSADFDLELDIDDAIVQAIDGVLIKSEGEEVKLLFYYYKPDGIDVEEETIRCKGIAEFRTTRSTFKAITKDFNGKLKRINRYQKKIDDYTVKEKQPMFV